MCNLIGDIFISATFHDPAVDKIKVKLV